MREDVKGRWVAALRSGDYKQTRETLRDCDGFCCLGVLCDLYIRETEDTHSLRARAWEVKRVFHVPVVGTGVDLYENAVLPNPVREWAGMETDDGSFSDDEKFYPTSLKCLSGLNDKGSSFEELADVIEKKWEVL